MGVISRRVLPACGNLCICCPELRSRSRQPVKRYKKLLADIFPKSQDEPPNDRKIGKLTEYASKNPLRIPKIAAALEQRGYKALRSERYSPVRIVMRAYSKLLSACRDQMPLFASSALTMIRILLDQGRSDFLQVLACMTFVDFLSNQTDSTYMRDVDALVPKFCALGRETGEERRRLALRSAGLQALATAINFMGKYSHISPEFDEIVTVVLDNYETLAPSDVADTLEGPEARSSWVKDRGPVAVMTRAITKLQSRKEPSRPSGLVSYQELSGVELESPKVWSQICIQNMARLGKEAITVRRVLEPMFRYFDGGNHWPPQKLALTVLRDMQHFMERSGNEQLSLPIVVRHLDHKSVINNPQVQPSIVEVLIVLARHSKSKATVAVVGAMSDLLRHLRKSIQSSLEASKSNKREVISLHKGLQRALEECLLELSKRVGDASPLIDMMAASLERLPPNPIVARSATEAVCVLAFCVAYVPDQSYVDQVFPEALFQELLHAMIHPDVETRVKAHHVFARLLVPSSLISRSDDSNATQTRQETTSTLSRSTSAFGSAAALFDKLRRERSGAVEKEAYGGTPRPDGNHENVQNIEMTEISAGRNKKDQGSPHAAGRSPGRGLQASMQKSWDKSLDRSLSQIRTKQSRELELEKVRLSGLQAALLLSTLWHQATLPDNIPSSYEAIANTYILTLLSSRAKTSSHKTAIRAFQLAISLRSLAMNPSSSGVYLPPSRRRSLFTLSTAMLVFAGKAYNVPQLGAVAKETLTSATRDPYLELSGDIRLKIVNSPAGYVNVKDYGSAADDRDAFKSFSGFSISENQTSEALAALIVGSSTVLGPDDFAVADQMLETFSAEEGYELGSQLYFETPQSCGSPLESRDSLSFDEALIASSIGVDGDSRLDPGAPDLPKLLASFRMPTPAPHVMGVSELLESALLAAGEVVNAATLDTLPYNAVAGQCETLRTGSRKKVSSLLNSDAGYDSLLLTFPEKGWQLSSSPQDQQSGENKDLLRLPPSSPYDNFLKAAGR